MPTRAQSGASRGPFAALLILLSLVLGSAASTAAGADLRGPSTRLGSTRQGPSAALLAAPARSALEDEAPGSGSGAFGLPHRPAIVTERLWTGPEARIRAAAPATRASPAAASYRARAPPAL